MNIEGADLQLNDLYVGYSTIHFDLGDINLGAIDLYNFKGIEDNTQISAINSFSLSGNNNTINKVYSGLTLNEQNKGHLNINEGGYVKNLSKDFLSAVSHSTKSANNTLTAVSNQVDIIGEENKIAELKSGGVVNRMAVGDFVNGGYTLTGQVIKDRFNNEELQLRSNLSGGGFARSSNAYFGTSLNTVNIGGQDNLIESLNNGFIENSMEVGNLSIDKILGQGEVVVLVGKEKASSKISLSSGIYGEVSLHQSSFVSKLNTLNLEGSKNNVNHIYNGGITNHLSVGKVAYESIEASAKMKKWVDDTYADAVLSSRISASNRRYSGFSSSTFYDNYFNVESNHIAVSGNNNTLGDIYNGYIDSRFAVDSITFNDVKAALEVDVLKDLSIGIEVEKSTTLSGEIDAMILAQYHIKAQDNTFTATSNSIELTGSQNKLSNILGGRVRHDLSFGDIGVGDSLVSVVVNSETETIDTPGLTVKAENKAELKLDLSNNILSAESNKVSIYGDENTLNDITAGMVDLNIVVGDVQAGKIITSTIINGTEKKIKEAGQANIEINAENTALIAIDNRVELKGSSSVSGNLIGGYIGFNIQHGNAIHGDGSLGDVIVNLEGTSATATDNLISIDGTHNFTNPETKIYGGYLAFSADYQPESYDAFTGNTLNYANQTPITINEIANFQTYNFALDPEQNKDIAMITANKISLGSNQDNFSDSSQQLTSDVFVTGIRSGKALSTGTEFLLMQGNIEGNGSGHDTAGLEQENVQQGISLLYDINTKIDAATGKITATIVSGHDEPDHPDPKVNPQIKSLLEGNLASLMLLTRSADNLAYHTFSSITEQNRKSGFVPFIQMSGHHARYNSGSHIDANGGLVTAGMSFQNDDLTLAIFSENGWDSYDSHNSFADMDQVDASGNNRFNGGGVFGQYNFNNGLYADASFRAGRLHSNYKTDDIRNAVTGEAAAYKIDSKYLGAHAGIGYQFQINPLNRYDLNLKYLWANTEAQDLMIAGDEIHFDKLNSHRLRLNGENSYQFNPGWSLLLGTGLEYEFEGEAEGTTYQRFRMDAPSVKGFTALGSLGVRFQPVSNKNLTVDFKAEGYLGERDGGGATLHMQYAF